MSIGDEQYVLVNGSLSEGYDVYGPYSSLEEVEDAAEGTNAVAMLFKTPEEAEEEL